MKSNHKMSRDTRVARRMLTGEDSIGVRKARAGITRPLHQCWKGLPQSSTHSANKDPRKKEVKTKRNIPQHNKTVHKESGVSTRQYNKVIHDKPRVSIPLTGENRFSPAVWKERSILPLPHCLIQCLKS